MTQHTVIYVPGLGDHNLAIQKRVLNFWRLYGVEIEVCAMDWLIDESWEIKLQRLLDRIDFHRRQGKKVSLVGISAGSSAVIEALVRRRSSIAKAVLVCGKFQYPENVHPMRYEMNPAFRQALVSSANSLQRLTTADKAKLRLYRPLYDNVLSTKESFIPGVTVKIMPVITHIGGIAYAITLGSWQIVRFLKKS